MVYVVTAKRKTSLASCRVETAADAIKRIQEYLDEGWGDVNVFKDDGTAVTAELFEQAKDRDGSGSSVKI